MPTSTEATSTTRGTTTTTQGIAAQLDPQNGEDLTVRSAEATNDPGVGVAPAHDTLPVTGVAAGALAIVGLALVGVGLVVVALGRRRLV